MLCIQLCILDCVANAQESARLFSKGLTIGWSIGQSWSIHRYFLEQSTFTSKCTLCLLFVGIFTGLVHDRFGARVTAICGTVVCSFGLLMVWGIASGHIQTNQLWLVGLVYAIGSNAQNWFDTPALITNSYNFHMNRGSIIGLQKT